MNFLIANSPIQLFCAFCRLVVALVAFSASIFFIFLTRLFHKHSQCGKWAWRFLTQLNYTAPFFQPCHRLCLHTAWVGSKHHAAQSQVNFPTHSAAKIHTNCEAKKTKILHFKSVNISLSYFDGVFVSFIEPHFLLEVTRFCLNLPTWNNHIFPLKRGVNVSCDLHASPIFPLTLFPAHSAVNPMC